MSQHRACKLTKSGQEKKNTHQAQRSLWFWRSMWSVWSPHSAMASVSRSQRGDPRSNPTMYILFIPLFCLPFIFFVFDEHSKRAAILAKQQSGAHFVHSCNTAIEFTNIVSLPSALSDGKYGRVSWFWATTGLTWVCWCVKPINGRDYTFNLAFQCQNTALAPSSAKHLQHG